MKQSVTIVGAGLGGLATALRLSHLGYRVRILEKNDQAGGRLNQLKQAGFTFDMGPSFFSMSYEFKELFDSVGTPMPLELEELDPVYGVNFAGEDRTYLIYKNLDRLAEQFADIEPHFRQKAEKYLKRAAQLFHDTEHRIVKRNFTGKLDYLGAMATVPLKHAPLLLRSMWAELERHFDSQQAKVIFSLVAFFLGATPFNTPAVYALLNYTELQHDGYWGVRGGMYRIVEALLAELEMRGVEVVYNTEVVRAEGDREVTALIDQHGHRWAADIYVCNADAAAFRGLALQRPRYRPERLDKLQWTLAPFTIYLGVQGRLDNVYHHNYFLGDNFHAYAEEIFRTQVAPEKPYYYLNVSSHTDPTCAPPGCENLFILCPVPDRRYKPQWDDAEQLADTIVADLSARIGYDLQAHTLTRTVMTPIDWEEKFRLYRGSGLGLAHGLNQVGALRPANKDEHFGNLYYVGASTIPGTGLPIVVISSRLVTERIQKEHAPTAAAI
ncbi:MAG: phytoene desaturase family protein [Sphingobacteriia bacterium]